MEVNTMATEVHIMSVAEYFLIAEMTPSGMPMSAVRITLHMASSIVTGSRFSISVSYTHLDVYKRQAWYWAHPPQYMPNNCNLAEVEHIKNFCNIPVVCAGKMEPEVAAEEDVYKRQRYYSSWYLSNQL